MNAVALQSDTRFWSVNMYESPLAVSELSYYIAYYIDSNGNYNVRTENSPYSFIVLPYAFRKATGISGDTGCTYLSYFELSEIGGVSL